MNYRMIFNIIGKIVCVEAVFMLPALLISLFHGESAAVLGVAVTMLLAFALGLPFALKKPKKSALFAREGFITVGLTWIAVSAVGALPFLISGSIPNYVDCLFETVSGFTTTGASILSDVEALPMGLLYWRSFTHWLGGMGVLVFVLALSPLTAKDSGESMHLLRAESPGIRITKLVPRMKRSAGILYAIYVALTLAEVILLLLGGMPLFDSVTLSFGTAGTGGFGILNSSIASYSAYSQWVIGVFMIVFGVNFNVYYLLLIRRFRKAVKNEELCLYLAIVLVSTLAIAVNTANRFAGAEETLRTAFFQVASIISTTGYSTVDFDRWPQISKTILLGLMFIGGCAGSTGGGAKVVRILLMFKSAKNSIYRVLHPNAVRLMHMDGEVIDDDTVGSVNAYMLLYFIIIAVVMLLISVDGQSLETTFSAVVACVNNIGPGFGAVGPAANFGAMSWFSKLVLTVSMLIGRLEIYPILILMSPGIWKE
ncbi:MAG: TrkH family potassium uptake protein [Butyricicoccus sp.]|nr:TrkH family potassium uptake protein [Butyricicoccus sp.]